MEEVEVKYENSYWSLYIKRDDGWVPCFITKDKKQVDHLYNLLTK